MTSLNTGQMLKTAVLYYRQSEQAGRLKFLPGRRLKNSYVALDLVLAKLASQMGWVKAPMPVNRRQWRQKVLLTYVDGLGHYLLVANLRNWNQLVLISPGELKKLGAHDRSKDLSQLYLAIKEMLYNSYFSHRQNDFTYSFKMYLKLGFCDLNFKPSAMVREFNHRFRLTRN